MKDQKQQKKKLLENLLRLNVGKTCEISYGITPYDPQELSKSINSSIIKYLKEEEKICLPNELRVFTCFTSINGDRYAQRIHAGVYEEALTLLVIERQIASL